ncbi:hypothetical protein [Nocardioides sp. TF02-7]|uniref:hypothetical protein n=1 Tax=Nocardioides sp. TF02-7 TaxID=2917724 RepID=UPI001F05FE88|nr:hypothetical protein [Nocardioides sp. TF02-7]UMG93195.1 hypothetical protein MF408_02505 [Nocardioides sp. TF02-7]
MTRFSGSTATPETSTRPKPAMPVVSEDRSASRSLRSALSCSPPDCRCMASEPDENAVTPLT